MHIWAKHIIIVIKNYLEDGLILWHVVPLGNIQRKFDQEKKRKKKVQSLPTLKKILAMKQETYNFFFFGLISGYVVDKCPKIVLHV